MKRTPISCDLTRFPQVFHPLFRGAQLFDSSSSPAARVYFIRHGQDGYYLKTAPKGSLTQEARLNRYFHSLHSGPEVLAYESLAEDWLLTRQVPGEDCTHAQYLSDPVRLADTTAGLLRALHEMPVSDCPVHHTERYIRAVRENHRKGIFDATLFPDGWGMPTVEEAHRIAEAALPCLKSDTLLHGDYCLPNIVLENWHFTGFIDLGNGGIGDRHIDLFWGTWTLCFNLHTDAYCGRFLDAYGRDCFDPELLRAVAAFECFL
ncbi:MAG: aminoglycoside 3'-phosphotransferase [Clostridia bacterium]|nr:aminoglycoside 3'-phosphotransferase [Clostridia bacterium]